ncbi:hypothetical protein F5Y18DRAFT_359423 [Xylariaceae sp. FL1019]|nr:hypothetical protein F5Y18DRAFT_359423 [Xylariaceae sp. FL1019]
MDQWDGVGQDIHQRFISTPGTSRGDPKSRHSFVVPGLCRRNSIRRQDHCGTSLSLICAIFTLIQATVQTEYVVFRACVGQAATPLLIYSSRTLPRSSSAHKRLNHLRSLLPLLPTSRWCACPPSGLVRCKLGAYYHRVAPTPANVGWRTAT